MKKLWILGLCLCLIYALTACQQVPKTLEDSTGTDAKTTTTTTVANVDDGGTGGDMDDCTIHQFFYHAISGNWTQEQFDAFIDYNHKQGSPEERFNIIEFVKYLEIPREDFPMWAGWTTHKTWDGNLDKPALSHYNNCPYTYNQFLDAIYGDDPELTEWVFSYETVQGLTYYYY